MRHFLFLLALAGASAPASGQQLWQNVAVGMTPDQVQHAQPNAHAPVKPDTLHGGAVCSLEIASFEIESHDYKICFFFLDNRLMQVTVHALGDPGESQFRGIVTLLRAKYGPELSLESTSIGYSADWREKNGVNISVIFLNRYGNLLNINYQIRMVAESDKL